MAEYSEDCCFNYPRDLCEGRGCPCACHPAEQTYSTDIDLETWRENAAAFYRQLDDLGY